MLGAAELLGKFIGLSPSRSQSGISHRQPSLDVRFPRGVNAKGGVVLFLYCLGIFRGHTAQHIRRTSWYVAQPNKKLSLKVDEKNFQLSQLDVNRKIVPLTHHTISNTSPPLRIRWFCFLRPPSLRKNTHITTTKLLLTCSRRHFETKECWPASLFSCEPWGPVSCSQDSFESS